MSQTRTANNSAIKSCPRHSGKSSGKQYLFTKFTNSIGEGYLCSEISEEAECPLTLPCYCKEYIPINSVLPIRGRSSDRSVTLEKLQNPASGTPAVNTYLRKGPKGRRAWVNSNARLQPLATVPEGSVQRIPPPPSLSGITRRAPAPSTVGVDPTELTQSDSVSQVGSTVSYANSLRQAEAEFRDTPRIRDSNGNLSFDDDEYFDRLDRLNRERSKRGLRVQQAPTPSTYTR
jgi:hypothetical protein